MLMTFGKLCEYSNWDLKKAGDDRANGADFIRSTGSRIVCDQDDCAAAIFYTDQRAAGHTVKVAGAATARLRAAMRDHADADQLTIVTLLSGASFAAPTPTLDLGSGFTSGSYVATALTVDVRNLRERVRQAVEADQPVIGGGDE